MLQTSLLDLTYERESDGMIQEDGQWIPRLYIGLLVPMAMDPV